ncbi:hypothetical protein SAMN05660874_01724 [Saccharopolyspora flava]|uniref:Uncharacterized protein n=2 Tax=Saccharopolyspora flava TaxID=95161 RepID=A0A1I6QQR1_9PSEU|nr:hypothetical protein SAMN05660874_01724 [Saccharopolyspora flava]
MPPQPPQYPQGQPPQYPQQQPPAGVPGYQPPANNPYPETRVGGYRDDPYADPYDYRDDYRDDRYDRYDDRYDDRYREPERDRYRDDYDRRERARDRDRDYDRRDRDSFRGPSADAIGRTVQVLTALIALVFVLHIVFSVSGANQDNDFVAFTYGTAKFFVLGLGDVFTPGDATIGLVLNYGLAALIYLFAGRIIARALRR